MRCVVVSSIEAVINKDVVYIRAVIISVADESTACPKPFPFQVCFFFLYSSHFVKFPVFYSGNLNIVYRITYDQLAILWVTQGRVKDETVTQVSPAATIDMSRNQTVSTLKFDTMSRIYVTSYK